MRVATVTERLEQVLEREAPSWGIRPVPPEHRRLSGFDFGVLWADLAIGLLVLLTGALLVPSLGLPRALLAIAVGSVIGCIPLALVGLAGAREGVPGMVLFRPVLGVRGSYLPSVLNIAQLVGWTGFELWAMALVADQMSRRLFHHSSYWLWLAVAAMVCTALALGGPILVIRRWLEKFGAWVVAAVGAWITIRVLTTAHLGTIWHRAGTGGYPGGFWLAVDLVIAMPVSWLPLAADYNRFARRGVSSAAGTFWGYAVGNFWFYALGALLVLGAGLSDASPAGLGQAIASLAGGWIVLLALLVGETDEAFADVYSAAVSSQNLEERIPQRGAVLAVGAAGVGLASWLGLRPAVALGNYEYFLFLLGSVFVPLFGVLLGHWAAGGAHPDQREVRFRPASALVWVAGFLAYQWSLPPDVFLPGWWVRLVERIPGALEHFSLGASLPSFVVAFVGAWVATRVTVTRGPAAGATAPRGARPTP